MSGSNVARASRRAASTFVSMATVRETSPSLTLGRNVAPAIVGAAKAPMALKLAALK
jgi:hypothetical protein